MHAFKCIVSKKIKKHNFIGKTNKASLKGMLAVNEALKRLKRVDKCLEITNFSGVFLKNLIEADQVYLDVPYFMRKKVLRSRKRC